jgi:very-short-patch-repair endonuclease
MRNEKNIREKCNMGYGQTDSFSKHVFSQKVNSFFELKIDNNEINRVHKKFDKNDFLMKVKGQYGNKYTYDEVNIISWTKKIRVNCNSCNTEFEVTPTNHFYNKIECPNCFSFRSKGEERIAKYLKLKNLEFNREFGFEDSRLRYDFYLPDYKMLIEFDGEQHFKAVDFFGGDQGLKMQQRRDKEKNILAENNGYQLIRISFDDFNNIEKILNNVI